MKAIYTGYYLCLYSGVENLLYIFLNKYSLDRFPITKHNASITFARYILLLKSFFLFQKSSSFLQVSIPDQRSNLSWQFLSCIPIDALSPTNKVCNAMVYCSFCKKLFSLLNSIEFFFKTLPCSEFSFLYQVQVYACSAIWCRTISN